MFAYIFERFPKFSQTFCYREVEEVFRQGEQPIIFSLRSPDFGPEARWDKKILEIVHYLPEGDDFARDVDLQIPRLPNHVRKILRQWRGKADSLRLYQAIYIGTRLQRLGLKHVHAHFAGMAARTAFWIKQFFGISFSVTVHANDVFTPASFKVGLEEILLSAGLIVAVSDFEADYLRRRFPEIAARIHRIYNGIDSAGFLPSSFDLPPLVLSVGRLIPKKGFDILIDACAALKERGAEFRCTIIGSGPLNSELRTRIQQRHLAGEVQLAGAKTQSEIAAQLSATTVFALPCRVDRDGALDNLPTVIMEAMVAAVPVVSTNLAGIPEMVLDGVTGLLVAPEDAAATAERIERFFRDAEMARAFGQRGRERALKVFSTESNVRALLCLLS